MIGLDTNVLVRAFVDEADETQTRASRSLLAGPDGRRETAYVNLVVLVEAVWMLRRFGKLDRGQVADFVEGLLETPDIVLADRDAITAAVGLYRTSRADFADVLIGLLNQAAGCQTTYTFDRGAAELPAYSPVPRA